MGKQNHTIRYVVIGVILFLGVVWSLALAGAEKAAGGYPNEFLVTAQGLKDIADDPDTVILDVRADKHFTGRIIPNAVRLKWSDFRRDSVATDTASVFVGVAESQRILGEKGIGRTDTLVLYDSVERDGGATASYVFWVLDVLGHQKKMVLSGGIDAWEREGYELDSKPRELSPILYQAPADEIRRGLLIDADFIQCRLGDPFYQIIDVRSPEEYRGEVGTKGLEGEPFKLGHIPTAVNIHYQLAWEDKKTKLVKSYEALREMHRGLDPDRGVIVYCNSGRRSSFSYFILRLMGFEHVYTYEASWLEWGNPDRFYPVETTVHELVGGGVPGTSKKVGKTVSKGETGAPERPAGEPKGGYVSCGG